MLMIENAETGQMELHPDAELTENQMHEGVAALVWHETGDGHGEWRTPEGALVLSWDEDERCWVDVPDCAEYDTVALWCSAYPWARLEVTP
ncbi:hypothetical protein LG274_02625 [Micrococcus antarcticus]|uniref:hypothetical protein n=1 Tax=Micrococcus antarcticus TaxID=86171 RepID=UPI00384A6BFD